MKILFLVPYPLDEAPSQRFRFEQYFEILSYHNLPFKAHSFFSSQEWKNIRQSGNGILRVGTLLFCWIKRLINLIQSIRYDLVFIHREACPFGPPVFEWLIAKIFNKKIIYDFDDAIWLTDNTHESKIEKLIRWRSKVASICRWSYKVSCGNEYLADFARQFNSNVIVIPTTIDTQLHHNPASKNAYVQKDREAENNLNKTSVTIGWTGSHSTLKYLEEIEPVLQRLEEEFSNVNFLVIADKPPSLHIKRLTFLRWTKETEAEDLLKIDIGIMPLPDDEWTQGKCGFKALQYLAMKIPAVVSPVGVNKKIVIDGVTGFCCQSQTEWKDRLKELIQNPNLRNRMGENGRKLIEQQFSVASNEAHFLQLFS